MRKSARPILYLRVVDKLHVFKNRPRCQHSIASESKIDATLIFSVSTKSDLPHILSDIIKIPLMRQLCIIFTFFSLQSISFKRRQTHARIHVIK